MRITYRMMTSKYSTNLNSLSSDLDKLNTQVATGRKYARTSEDVSSAVRGYQIRRNLSKLEGYQDNIKHATDFLTNSETTLGQIEASLSEAADKILQGMNGTQSKDDRAIIAKELDTIQDQLFETLNTSVSGVFLFGGSNNQKPFTRINEGLPTEKLVYNSKTLEELDAVVNEAEIKELKDDSLYVDIGLGVEFEGPPDNNVKRNTVFNYSIPGINFVGNGKTTISSGEVSNNFYDLIGSIKEELLKDDGTYSDQKIDEMYGLLKESIQKSYQTTTQVGSKTNYLEFMTERYETQNYNLQDRQVEVEGVDAAYTYIAFQSQKVAYQAALQMGQSVVQQSVFDYMS